MDENFVLERIEDLCKKKGYSHYRLAMKSGVHQSSLSTLLNRRSTPNVFTLDKICKGFDVTIAQFFSPEGEYTSLSKDEEKLITMWDGMSDMQKALTLAYMQGVMDTKL